ncbi:MAG: lipopolysaccharide biosynthesis protein [Pseudomonadota bacterium]
MIWNLGNVAVSGILTLAVFLITSRILAPADFGAVALATAIVTMVGTLVPTAFGEALVQRADLRPEHLHSTFWLTAASGTLIAVAVGLSAPFFAAWTGSEILTAILPVLALRLVFDAVLTVPASLIVRRMKFRVVALRTTFANAVGGLFCLWMVLSGYAIWALIFQQLINALTCLVISLWTAGYRPAFIIRLAAIRDLRRFGLFSMGSRMLNEARIDQFLLGLVLGTPALGLFYFARRLFLMLREGTAGVFSPVTGPLIASLNADAAKRRTAYLVASFASAALAFPLFGGLLAVAPQAIPIVFGPQWTEAVFAVQGFCVLGMLAGLGVIQASLIRNIGHPDWWFAYQAVVQLSVIPIILLVNPFGLDAVMLTLVLRTVVLWPISLRKVGQLLDMPLGAYLSSLRGPALGTAAMIPVVSALPYWAPGLDGAPLVASQVLLGTAIYALILVATSHRKILNILRMIREKRGISV